MLCDNMKKILLITNYFYPKTSVATNRMVAFAKYLNYFGYKVYVVTDGNEDRKIINNDIDITYVKDNSMFRTLDTNIKENMFLHYIKCMYNIIFNNLDLISNNWINKVVNVSQQIINENNIDIIISSYPSIENIVIGSRLKEKNKYIYWIADMRDALWTTSVSEKIRNNLLRIGKVYLNNADGILGVSKPQVDGYKKFLMNNKIAFCEVRNGFDFNVKLNNNSLVKKEYFNIVYAGIFYGDRKPDNFFKALENIINNKNIHVTIIGNSAPIHIPNLLKENIYELDRLNYNDLIEYMQNEADALLMISPKSVEKGAYTGKIFDYLGCCKPILALVPKDDVAANLIEKANAGYVAENENIIGIEKILNMAYDDWKNKNKFISNIDIIKKHHRKNQVKILDKFIQSLLKGKS